MNTAATIESILFYAAEPVSFETLGALTECGTEELAGAIAELERNLEQRGIRLVRDTNTLELATAPEAHDVIEQYQSDQHTKRLGKAGLETLTIVLYHGPLTRRDIDYIRGVNSTHILRNLAIRGLVRKQQAESSARETMYAPTVDLLRWLGVGHQSELPEYDTIQEKLSESDQSS